MLLQLAIVCLAILTRGAWMFEGETCFEPFTKTEGRCADGNNCQSAINDFLKYGVRPTRCESDRALFCCRDGIAEKTTQAPIRRTTTTSRPLELTDPPEPTESKFDSEKRPGALSIKKCKKYSKSVTETIIYGGLSLTPALGSVQGQKCEYTGTELIVGGEVTKQGEFPHMAAIGWRTFGDSFSFECGGTLISERFVLTVGHCTYSTTAADPLPAVVRLGDQNLNPLVRDGAHPIDVAVKNVYKHPEYKSPIRYNDIALLELERDVTFSNDIRPACLWVDEDFGKFTKAVATGWGIVNSTSGQRSNELLKVSLSLLDSEGCNETLFKLQDRNWRQGFVSSQLCAGETREEKDTCRGDSGSPLQVVSGDNQCIFKIMGLTSFGAKICGNKLPAVYTRVSSYLSWIENTVWPGES